MPITTSSHIPTIVYVEDNAGDAILLGEALRERGHSHNLLVIEKGDKALRYFQIKASAQDLPPPHCILLDAFLPIITGGQLLRFIRGLRIYDYTPVYIFAAKTEYKDILAAKIVSEYSFITKTNEWEGFLKLADLLMLSAEENQYHREACSPDYKPEVRATGELRRYDPKE